MATTVFSLLRQSETTELNTGYNFDLLFGSASPVNFFPPTSDGVYDVFGKHCRVCSVQCAVCSVQCVHSASRKGACGS